MDVVAIIPAYSHINWRLLSALHQLSMPYIQVHGCSDLIRARSQLLTDALETEAKRILFLDSDMVPTPEQITQLVNCERVDADNAISGCYLTRPDELAARLQEPSAFEIGGERRFLPALGFGMGFSVIDRRSAERLAAKLPRLEAPEGPHWFPFFLPFCAEESPGRTEYYQEDYAFWWRLHSLAGVSLWLDTHLAVGHLKVHELMPTDRIEAPDQ